MLRWLPAALRCELLKARRARAPLLAAAAFSLAPLVSGLFVFIMKDPDRAREIGLLRAKAELFAGAADWATFLGLLAQAVTVGGSLLFSFLVAWCFGREFADRTIKTLLALPMPRAATVTAKLLITAALAMLLTAWVFLLGLAVGAVLGLEGGSGAVVAAAALRTALAAGLSVLLLTPVALVASIGRGYLAPLAFALLMLVLAQLAAATGWGPWFPWSVPPLAAGLAGPEAMQMSAWSYALVAAVGLAGAAGTAGWWERADHTT